MSNGKQLDRSINMLRPMEINGPDDTKEKQEDESEERIRSAKERSAQTKTAVKDKSNNFMKTLLLMTTISLMSMQVVAETNCKWTSGIPFNIPEKWNCEKNPWVKHKRTTSPVTPQFCRTLYSQTQVTGIKLIQSSPNKWMTNNEIQYSYGWLGVRCQSTINFVLIKGEIFFYEGRGLVSNLDDTDKCMIQKGECMINTSTVLWNSIEVINHCPYKRIGRFDTIRYGNHFIIKELQSLFILDNETHSSTMKNCKFNNPYPMKGYIILEKNTREERNFTTNSTQETQTNYS
ncbi:hypothetical protein WUBG_17446 [Wuchereria bancrofti]|uniref:Uncharacterized protein n=1 Tax=Wuchereria bancrofti TaxID=6293 RepID=J9E8H3_WUCBA|nr:hypothetical protein WUBG_17446 [Wuchereria bancrofti]